MVLASPLGPLSFGGDRLTLIALWVGAGCATIAAGLASRFESVRPALVCHGLAWIWAFLVSFAGYWTTCGWLHLLDPVVVFVVALATLHAAYDFRLRYKLLAHVVPLLP